VLVRSVTASSAAQLAADIAQQAARCAHRQLAGAGFRVIDELVDRQVGIGTDRHRRLIEKQQLGLPVGFGGDALVEHDFLADDQLSHGSAGRPAGRLGIDRAADPDPLLRQRAVRPGEQKHQGNPPDAERK
jgi:hypothetical protein